MGFVKTVKERICESNKKVSFSQKSSVDTKVSTTEKKIGYVGQSFSFYKGEVIESGLFERVTRDCGGNVIRTASVRRFRKVGLDEWFSILASIGNDIWNNDFLSASNEDAIEQGEKNNNKVGSEQKIEYPASSVSTAESFTVVNPIGDEQKALNKKKRNSNALKITAAAAIVIGVYIYYNKK
jgi:hypothetical protein